MCTRLITGFAVLAVAVIFIIQNAYAANISFQGVHLVLPPAAALLLAAIAGALLLAAIAGALLMAAAGPARVTQPGRSSGAPVRKARALSSPRPFPAGAPAPADDTRKG